MASKRSSSAVTRPGKTILEVALTIIAKSGNEAMAPSEIADAAIERGLLRVPRGRTVQYVDQLLQSTLYDNAFYAAKPSVYRAQHGRYKAHRQALRRIG